MIQIDPKITQIPGFDENCLWFVFKVTQIKMNYKNTNPKIETLEKWTGWGKNKVRKVVNQLVKLELLKKDERYNKDGGQTSNSYTITTKFVSYLSSMEGEKIEDEVPDINDGDGDTQNREGGDTQKGTHNITNSNSLNSSSNKKISEVENFNLDDMRKTLWLKKGYTEDGIIRHTLNWKDYVKGLDKLPVNLSSSLDNYLSNHLFQFLKEQKSIENVAKADALAKQRINDFHSKKQDNIKLVGTNPVNLPQGRKPIFKPYYRDYKSREAYENAITDARQNGQIVETDQLPINAAAFWGEENNKYTGIIKSVDDDIYIDENARKNELYKQIKKTP